MQCLTACNIQIGVLPRYGPKGGHPRRLLPQRITKNFNGNIGCASVRLESDECSRFTIRVLAWTFVPPHKVAVRLELGHIPWRAIRAQKGMGRRLKVSGS